MAVLLALTSAVVYGAADFCGGLAARRAAALAVVAVSQLAGLVTLLALLPALGGDPAPAGLAWGAAAGLAGAVGLVLFYRTLAAGVMSVVAPVTAVCAAGLPVLVGLGRGEHVAALGVAGIGLGLVAVGLVAAENGQPTVADLRQARVLPAVVAGTAFGVFFVLLDQPGRPAACGRWSVRAWPRSLSSSAQPWRRGARYASTGPCCPSCCWPVSATWPPTRCSCLPPGRGYSPSPVCWPRSTR